MDKTPSVPDGFNDEGGKHCLQIFDDLLGALARRLQMPFCPEYFRMPGFIFPSRDFDGEAVGFK